jgi:DNA mismatch repair protein MutL
MKEIKILDNHIINNIAAGEVVEKPASIVKELVENSIDANSTNITVEIKAGGTTYIRVTDNGQGISKNEIKTAFLRHATSKITNMLELENVSTMGFRGEALSSISSVSHIEITTKTKKDTSAALVNLEGGVVTKESTVASLTGTSIIVKNLFYNIPARKKFLKKNSIESGHISDYITKLCLANPKVSFHYINNGTTIIKTKGDGDLSKVIFQIYGKDVFQNIVKVNYNKNNIEISGFLVKPEVSRGTRNYQHLFINGRIVTDKLVRTAIETCFKGKIPIGKFPLFILTIKLDPSMVDVNVHPNKTEVRFSNENLIYESVTKAINESLKSEQLIPKITINNKFKEDDTKNYIYEESLLEFEAKEDTDYNSNYLNNSKIKLKEDTQYNSDHLNNSKIKLKEDTDYNNNHKKEKYLSNIENIEKYKITSDIRPINIEEKELKKPFFNNYVIKGQIFNTYWIIEQKKSIYLVDQHAMHEKILYEELNKKLKSKNINSQRLVMPIVVKLSDAEFNLVEENISLLDSFGFELELFGEKTYALRSVPFIIKGRLDTSFFMEIIDIISQEYSNISNVYEAKQNLIASIACKSAVKGNEALNYIEAKALIEKALQAEDPFSCPHGRPTIIEITKYEIEKKFHRV